MPGYGREASRSPAAAAGGAAGAAALAVIRLRLEEFRSFRSLGLEVPAEPVVLAGPNGGGKTNLLEALSLLVPGRGLRGARLSEMRRRPSNGAGAHAETADGGGPAAWAVAARLARPAGALDIGTGPEPGSGGERRIVRIDGETQKSQAALAERACVVWLTPEMDRLFADRPSARRRFLDRLVFGIDPGHARRVAAYERALKERARLLAEPAPDSEWLAALEATMAESGVAVAAARNEAAARLSRASASASGPFPKAALAVSGAVEEWLQREPALAAEDRFRAELAAKRAADAAAGRTQVGPHTSDLRVTDLAEGRPAALGSTGEQKALLVAVLLAHARLLAAERDAAPLLLLDEAASHLDEARRRALFEEILALGAQAWLAGTDAAVFRPLRGRARFYAVAESRLDALD